MAAGLELADSWATDGSLGRRGIAEQVERACRLATRFAEGLRRAGHEILNQMTLNQVLVPSEQLIL